MYGADEIASSDISPVRDTIDLRIGYVPVVCGLPLFMVIENGSFLDKDLYLTLLLS